MSIPRRPRTGRPAVRTQSRQRPLRSYLLRVVELHRVSVEQLYELVDLQAGRTHRFADLAALRRHLDHAGDATEAAPETAPNAAAGPDGSPPSDDRS